MTSLSPEAQERQARLTQRYLNSLPGKQSELESCWEAVCANDWNAKVLARLKSPVHRLAGSAGSYGLDKLCAAAQALDRLLKVSDSSPVRRGDIQREFERLLEVLAEAQKKT